MKLSVNEQLKGKMILFATVPGEGHFNPLTGLAKYLQTLGCDVRWYTSAIFTGKLNKMEIQHYPFVKALDVNGVNINDLFPERNGLKDAIEKTNFDLINIFANRAPEYYQDIQDIYESFPFELMIADSMFSAIPFVKVKMSIPVIAIGIIPLAEVSEDLAPYGMALLPPANAIERAEYAKLRDFIPNVFFKNSIDIFAAILSHYNISNKESVYFDQLIRSADLYLQIGSPDFEYTRSDLGDNIRFIGALLPYSSTTKQHWFDERLNQYEKIVLVTQGTVEGDVEKLLVPTLQAFKDTDTLVIATTGGNGTQALREKYTAENIIIEDYIPFTDVMPFAKVYVTNGGYGGTLLSIKNKLPMVAAGVHEGKNEVCARIGYFNYGIDLKTEVPTSEAIYNAVEKVMWDESYKINVSMLAGKINNYHANELCANYAASLLNEYVIESM